MSGISLPVLKDGDKLTGQACAIPANLSYCALCDCVRAFNMETWTKQRIDGGPTVFICHRHKEEKDAISN